MTDRQKVPWARLGVESVAIVASILIAFAIDTWWDERQDREHERIYLGSLRQEFADSLAAAASSEELRHVTVAAHESLVAQIQGARRAPDGDLYTWISLASYPIQYNPPRAVFNDLVASGGTLLIRSDELRLALARFDQELVYLKDVDDTTWAVWGQRIQPFLEGRVPRVERLRQGFAATRTDLPFGQSPHKPDFDGVLADPRFEDMLAERWLRLQNGLLSIQRLSTFATEIIKLIDVELEQQ